AGECVRTVDVRTVDRAVDVDRRRAAGQRREHRLVEVAPTLRVGELQEPVGSVAGDPGDEPTERLPVEGLTAAREVGDPGEQKQEVDEKRDDPLPELR